MAASHSALLIVAAFSRHAEALGWGREQLERVYGLVELVSSPYLFNQTSYYEVTMGRDLHKQFFVFRDLVALDCLADVKRHTNDLEQQLAGASKYPEVRPLNLDPGLLTLGKFMLATTKDQAHRLYLHDGIFAEVTLRFQDHHFEPWPWTYADYRQECVRDFLRQARDYYRQRLRCSPGDEE
jgi:hypothetical protein